MVGSGFQLSGHDRRRRGDGRAGCLRAAGAPLRRPAIAIASIIGVSIVSSTLSQIFRIAVYEYALTGEAVGDFDGQLLQTAFVQHAA